MGHENLVTFKGVAELGGAETGWFNGVEGIDEWRGQDAFIIGRPLPMPYVVEDIARAIWQNGEPDGSIGAWYPKKKIAYVGERGMAWTERHPDPRCEAARKSICEGQSCKRRHAPDTSGSGQDYDSAQHTAADGSR